MTDAGMSTCPMCGRTGPRPYGKERAVRASERILRLITTLEAAQAERERLATAAQDFLDASPMAKMWPSYQRLRAVLSPTPETEEA